MKRNLQIDYKREIEKLEDIQRIAQRLISLLKSDLSDGIPISFMINGPDWTVMRNAQEIITKATSIKLTSEDYHSIPAGIRDHIISKEYKNP